MGAGSSYFFDAAFSHFQDFAAAILGNHLYN
jgi:hypothetical protein